MKRRRLFVYTVILVLFAVALVLSGFAVNLARQRAYDLIHPGRSQPHTLPTDVGIGRYEDVTFTSADGLQLGGWFIAPAPDANGATVLIVHGMGSNRGGLIEHAAYLTRAGYGALLMELRNHGASEGSITTLGYNEILDVRGALDWLKTRPDVNPDRLILYGESLGGATVLRAAAAYDDAAAVVAVSAYSSIEDNISEGVRRLTGLPPFPFAPLVIYFGQAEAGLDIRQVRPVDEVARISPRPVLFVHGDQDNLIDVSNAERNYAAAGEPKALYIVAGGNHGDLLGVDAAGVTSAVLAFLERYGL